MSGVSIVNLNIFCRSLLNCMPLPLCTLPIIDMCLMHLCAYTAYSSLKRAFTLANKHLTYLFLSFVVVLIVKYGLSLKNPRKATGSDFIHLKVIKFASNVNDSHLYNIIIKDLEKNKCSEEPKTTLIRSIFKKNKRNKQCINY